MSQFANYAEAKRKITCYCQHDRKNSKKMIKKYAGTEKEIYRKKN